MNPAALTSAELANLLSKAGGRAIAPTLIEEQLAAGAPRNADGTLHFVHFTAWLAGQVS